MYVLTNKPEMGARFYDSILPLSLKKDEGVDVQKMVQHLAGVLVETYLVFDQPDRALQGSFSKLSRTLACVTHQDPAVLRQMPDAHMLDAEIEKGRNTARVFFEDWMDCAFEFHDLILSVVHNVFMGWEQDGMPRQDSLAMLYECTRLGLAMEISAQELCDVVIDRHVARHGWDLADCIAALSAVAGRRLAQSLNSNSCMIFKGSQIPDNLDRIVYVMTKEAVRLGVPAGSDWRFGLAANDMPINAPVELINAVEPYCHSFFQAIDLDHTFVQAVCCAKAAGRMVAVAAGGEIPEIEPAIAKPLAMAAMTESYKFVCLDQVVTGS